MNANDTTTETPAHDRLDAARRALETARDHRDALAIAFPGSAQLQAANVALREALEAYAVEQVKGADERALEDVS